MYRIKVVPVGIHFGFAADVLKGRRLVHETATYPTRTAALAAAEAWVADAERLAATPNGARND
jgi:hypothetical protein